jgi:hypothetical protein
MKKEGTWEGIRKEGNWIEVGGYVLIRFLSTRICRSENFMRTLI